MRSLFLLGCLLYYTLCHAVALQTVTEDWPPYNTLLNAQQADGAYARVVRIALQRSGLPSDIQVYPWARSMAQTSLRPDTLLFALARIASREDQFIWIGKLDELDVYLWRKPGQQTGQHTLQQIRDCCSICTIRRDASEDILRQHGFDNRQLIVANNHTDCLRLVRSGTVDYLALPYPPLQMLLRQQGQAVDSLQRGPLLLHYSVYLAASRGTRPRVIQSLRDELARMARNGESRKIIAGTLQQVGILP